MIENNLADLAPQSGVHTARPRFLHVEQLRAQPELALGVTLLGVNVNRFLAFIGIEENPPAADLQNGRHTLAPNRVYLESA
jgi:hypothetical protein